MGIPSECLITEASDVPKTIQANGMALGCPAEPDGKTILLKTPTHFGCRTGAELEAAFPPS